MRLYRDRAVVLRQHKLGEADRIVTLLTLEHGLVRAVAKGVRRTRSKFGAKLEPFAHIDVQLYPGRNLDVVTQVLAIDAFASDIVGDYGRYTCGCAVLETAERLAGEERSPSPALHRLTVAALRAVADGGRDRELVLDSYLLRAMGIAGWAPALTDCARCAAPGPHRAFHVAAGGSVCMHCRPSGSVTPPQGVLELMSALQRGDWAVAGVSTTSHRSQASGLVAAHLQWHLERQLRTLPLVERIYRIDRTVADRREARFGQDEAHGVEAGGQRAKKDTYPQLPPAPEDYPTFPDMSTWPVAFPELPPETNGPFCRPPQHTSKASAPLIPEGQVPSHVAVVMDGNGRWATGRGLNRTDGHKMGEAVLIDVICGAIEVGIEHLSVYAFSTENWKRSPDEVRFLMGFNREVVRRRRENLRDLGVRMRWVGSRPRLWRSVIKELDIAEQMTLDNDVITINYCVNYGGRTEIVEAARELAQAAVDGKVTPGRISEPMFAKNLHRDDIPDVDLFIRTSGEKRASNFLLWQAAYAEYVFQDTLWPDYDRRDLWAACEEYVSRNRRFGRAE